MMKPAQHLSLFLLLCLGLTACGGNAAVSAENAVSAGSSAVQQETESSESSAPPAAAEPQNIAETEETQTMLNLTINGTAYQVELEENVTVSDISAQLPLELTLGLYAGHEYYAELPFTPTLAEERTTQIQAGHLYYWDGWNAFVINFEDMDIAPYQVVHLGAITDPAVSTFLASAGDSIQVTVAAE